MYKYCYVFDTLNELIYKLNLENLDPNIYDNDESVLDYFNIDSSTCSWMFSDADLSIISINKPLY